MEASNEIAVKILKNSSLAIKASIAVINSNYKDQKFEINIFNYLSLT